MCRHVVGSEQKVQSYTQNGIASLLGGSINAELGTVRHAVDTARMLLLAHDSALLDIGAHERTISHRFAVYLEQIGLFDGFAIDCEYNRSRDRVKKLAVDSRFKSSNRSTDQYYPDIVVHRRGLDTHNLLNIEMKRVSCNAEEARFDFAKLWAAKVRFGYRHVLFILIPSSKHRGVIGMEWNPDPCQFTEKWTQLMSLFQNCSGS